MDSQAAKEYHAMLWEKLLKREPLFNRVFWIPLLALPAYFVSSSWTGALLGGLIGWGICAILSSIDNLLLEITKLEFSRHLHEHTDEAEAGEKLAKIRKQVELASRRWSFFR